jgi:hypothetical protein
LAKAALINSPQLMIEPAPYLRKCYFLLMILSGRQIVGFQTKTSTTLRATCNVHLSRGMTDFERQTLPSLMSGGFSPSEATGSN